MKQPHNMVYQNHENLHNFYDYVHSYIEKKSLSNFKSLTFPYIGRGHSKFMVYSASNQRHFKKAMHFDMYKEYFIHVAQNFHLLHILDFEHCYNIATE